MNNKYLLLSFFVMLVQGVCAQSAVQNSPVIQSLLDRIGGNGTASRFETVIDPTLSAGGKKDVFVLTAKDGKPCIKGNSVLSVTTGIEWYLKHHLHQSMAWNRLKTDLSTTALPLPAGEEQSGTR